MFSDAIQSGLKLIWCHKNKRFVLGSDLNLKLAQHSSVKLSLVKEFLKPIDASQEEFSSLEYSVKYSNLVQNPKYFFSPTKRAFLFSETPDQAKLSYI